ncbi:MAG: helix-turn-helix transcriptional regulator [Clostridia bacterium]|nr:helix-turn-helix transcriptional regulator [Clostridia bacterium]
MHLPVSRFRYSPKKAPISAQYITVRENYVARDAHMHHLNELLLIPCHAKAFLFSNGNRLQIQTPALILHRAGSYHYIDTEDVGPEGYSCYCIHFAEQHVKQIPEALLHSDLLFSDDCLVLELTEEQSAELFRYAELLSLEETCTEKNLFLLLILLNEAHRLLKTAKVTRQNTSNSYIFDVVQYLVAHYNESLTTQQIASAFHVSVSKINNDFQHITGQTLNRFCNNLRLTRAGEFLITHPHLSIAEIAARCGFSSESYFIQSFQKSNGLTPNAYRKKVKKEEEL